MGLITIRRTSFVLFLYFNVLLLLLAVAGSGNNNNDNMNAIPVKVGVVLDMEKTAVGRMGLTAINMALSDLYASHPRGFKTRLALDVRDSKGDVVAAAAAAVDLINNVRVKAIIGPVTSAEAQFIVSLGEKVKVPIVSYSATSPLLVPPTTKRGSSYFIRACQNDAIEAQAIGAVVKYFGWKEAIPIYVGDEFGQGMFPSLADALPDTRIPYRRVISPSATDDEITQELYKLRALMSTRVFIVHLPPSLGSRLFIKASEAGMMGEGHAWILSSGMTAELGSLDETTIESMQGVLGVRAFVPDTLRHREFARRWKRKFPAREDYLNVYGLWAYDTATALAMAIERVGNETTRLWKPENTVANSTINHDLAKLGHSEGGTRLLQSLLDTTKFTGLSGDFNLFHGRLNTSVLEVVNVFGVGWKSVGFWTPENGLVNKLADSSSASSISSSFSSSTTTSSTRRKLGTIIWPGDATTVPDVDSLVSLATTTEKPVISMRVLVPRLRSFEQFLHVYSVDPQTNKCDASGFSIDVFEEVMRTALAPSPVSIEYFSYRGSFDQAIKNMHDQRYNACSGDITIRANRFKYAGFTQPYTESGVSMVAPAYSINKSHFFVKVVTWQLAAATMGLFLLNAVVIWIFEHKHNKHFKRKVNPTDRAQRPFFLFVVDQVVESLYFSFSTMFFVQRQSITSNWTRLVMVIWFFVFLILTQSYTASMASYLSARQLFPKFHDLNEIRKAGYKVGYQNGSFVKDILNNTGFNETQLETYGTIDEMYQLLSKGAIDRTHGVVAIVDELPFLRLFLAKYCREYTLVNSVRFNSDGFGFAFQINSPYLHNVSEAIVRSVENNNIDRIFSKWIENSTCSDYEGSQYNFYQLNLGAFRLLYLISVFASSAGIIWYPVAGFPGERKNWCRRRRRNRSTSSDQASEQGDIRRPNDQVAQNTQGMPFYGRISEPSDSGMVLQQRPRRLRVDVEEPGGNLQGSYDMADRSTSSPLSRNLTFPSFSSNKYFPLGGMTE